MSRAELISQFSPEVEGGTAMERLYLWPANPAASLFALWIVSQIFFYFARQPVHRALREA